MKLQMRVFRLGGALLVQLLTFNAGWVDGQESDRIVIEEGQSRVMELDFEIKTIATGDPKVCRGVKIDAQKLLINAQNVGTTNLVILGPQNQKRELRVEVKSRATELTAEELQNILAGVEGVKVRIVGRQVVLEGQVLTQRTLDIVERITKGMPNVVNLLEFSPLMKKIVSKEIAKALRAEGLQGIKVKVVKNSFVLAGSAHSEAAAQRAEKIALAYSQNIVNAVGIDDALRPDVEPILIQMDLNIMEIEKNALKDLGIFWNPDGTLDAQGSLTAQTDEKPNLFGALLGTLTNLLPKMRRIQEDGLGRSLSQQSVVTQNGTNADFFVGTEIPILVAQQVGVNSIDYKKVGLTLKFAPFLGPSNIIDSPISIESSFVAGEGAGGAPIVGTAQLNTIISLASGRSVALAGLIGQREAEALLHSPPGDIDTSLYQANKSRNRANELREIVVFVTPRVLAGAAEAVREIGEKVEDSFKEKELDILLYELKKVR